MSSIDYDLTQIRAVVFDVDGVLSPSTVPMDALGNPLRMANIKDGYALQLAVKRGLRLAIITGADCPAVMNRFSALGIRDIYLRASEKLPLLREWLAENALEPREVAFVGDDIPDLPAMHAVGLSVAPADAATEVREMARYISPANGGCGVARDLLEQILKAQDLWLGDSTAFGW